MDTAQGWPGPQACGVAEAEGRASPLVRAPDSAYGPQNQSPRHVAGQHLVVSLCAHVHISSALCSGSPELLTASAAWQQHTEGCLLGGLEALLKLLPRHWRLLTVVLGMQARDLATLGCSCTELLHTAGTDALWQVLFNQEFGYVQELDSTQGGSLRWQRLFARTWLDRYCLQSGFCRQLKTCCQLLVVSEHDCNAVAWRQ